MVLVTQVTMKKALYLLSIVPFLTGCIGGQIQTQFATINKVDCLNPSLELYIFTDGEIVDFEYASIGILEIQGGEYSSLEEVFGELKKEAKRNCANAVINVKQSTTLRETEVLFDDPDEGDLYTASVLTGLAVSVEIDDEFRTRHASRQSN